jgi:hypothetical protein
MVSPPKIVRAPRSLLVRPIQGPLLHVAPSWISRRGVVGSCQCVDGHTCQVIEKGSTPQDGGQRERSLETSDSLNAAPGDAYKHRSATEQPRCRFNKVTSFADRPGAGDREVTVKPAPIDAHFFSCFNCSGSLWGLLGFPPASTYTEAQGHGSSLDEVQTSFGPGAYAISRATAAPPRKWVNGNRARRVLVWFPEIAIARPCDVRPIGANLELESAPEKCVCVNGQVCGGDSQWWF